MIAEGMNVEYKREYVDDVKQAVIAFANCDGGDIVIGVDDDGHVRGVSDADDVMLRVTNAIRDAIRPDVTMFVTCTCETMSKRRVVRISVRRGTARPYYLHGKGVRPEGVFVRQGASTVPASDAAILAMIKETSGDSYESARSIAQELTFEASAARSADAGLDFGAAQMRTLKLIGDDGAFTDLAFLLSDQCTHTMKLALFEGSEKTVFKDRREITGSLFTQLDGAFEFIDKHNRTRADFPGLARVDTRDYPIEALREALLNAVVHRDYSFSGPALVSMFDDRIEFVTIGGLVRGISMSDVMLGVSALRNPNLANVLYRLRFIEGYGTGIMKINECYRDFERKPKIEASDNAFKITLPNVNFGREQAGRVHRASAREEVVVDLCRKNGSVMRRDVQSALGVSQATAGIILREMTERGTLIKEGAGRMVRYYMK